MDKARPSIAKYPALRHPARLVAVAGLSLVLALVLASVAWRAGVAAPAGSKPGARSKALSAPAYRETNFLMDTIVQVSVWGNPGAAKKAGDAAFAAMKEVAAWSDAFSPESEVSHVNAAAGKQPVKVSGEFLAVLEQSREFSRSSAGAFDVTVGPVMQAWGFGTDKPRVPAKSEITTMLKLVGYQKVRLDKAKSTVFLPEVGMRLDLGAVAKGYAVDRAGEAIRKAVAGGKVTAGLINAGGDVLVVGNRPQGGTWNIGIQHPRGEGIITTVPLAKGAAVTSGDYERFFEEGGVRYSHIIDPRTGYQPRKLVSVTILAPDSTVGDMLSTALFVLGPAKGEALLRRYHAQAVYITPDLEISRYQAAGR